MISEPELGDPAGQIGVARPREDSAPKLRGAVRFGADLPQAGLLHGRLVLSYAAHARIVSVDAAEALAVPGVVAVLTADDLPIPGRGDTRTFEPLAREEVVFAGQPIALVVAETEAAAEDGAEAVLVELEPLPAAIGLEASMAPGAPPVRLHREEVDDSAVGAAHTSVGEGAEVADDEELSANVVERFRYREADAAAALAASDAVVEGRFETPWLHQAYLEPPTATALVEPDGEVVVWASTQGAFHTRAELAKAFDLPLDRVRVVATPLGGGFGGKVVVIEPLACAAALALRRPVRVVFTRSEDFLAANPNPGGFIELRIGANRSGKLTGLDARIAFERGAHSDWGIESVAAALIGGVYRWPAHDVRAYGVETNRVGFGAYRAPGAPPAIFALESLLEELAAQLGLDPVELRLRNLVEPGDQRVDGKPWPRIGAQECIERLRDHELWRRRDELPPGEGVGFAVGLWPGASGAASAACRFDEDGKLTVETGSVDMSGTASGFATIAAAAFGIPVEQVRVVATDTAAAPRSPISGGSQITYSVGRAVVRAAEDAREQLLRVAAAELEADPDDLELVGDAIQPRGAPSQAVPLTELATRLFAGSYAPVHGHGGAEPIDLSPSVAAHLAHVRIDAETGDVRVLAWVIAQDVGRALNPALCEGQMRGGVAQAIGWALYEELLADEEGQLVNGSFIGYEVPGAPELPPIETLIVEVPSPHGPFGAKGIGEAPVVGGPAAVASAIAAATGVRMRELPMTPERVWAALGGSPE
jgi:CO/xanthine dehydrogenase Mo-binding subunit